MAKHNIIKTIILSSLAILATSCGENAMDEMTIDDTPKTYTLIFDAQKPSFESEEGGTTRANGTSWDNGDVIYIVATDKFSAYGKYDGNSWVLKTLNGTIPSNVKDQSCSVYYFKGVNDLKATVSFNRNTAIYHTSEENPAKYSISSNNEITINAQLVPKAFRFRFKNNSDKNGIVCFKIEGVEYYTGWNCSNKKSVFTHSEEKIHHIQLNANDCSDYYYGWFASGNPSKLKITINYNQKEYTRSFTQTIDRGASRIITLDSDPTKNQWTKTGDDYVNLDFKYNEEKLNIDFATCNLGANCPEESGDYYDWEVAVGKNNSFSQDIVQQKLGDDWRLPTYEEIASLKYSGITWTNLFSSNKVMKGEKDSKVIILPFCDDNGESGTYWSSSVFDTDKKLTTYDNNDIRGSVLYIHKNFQNGPETYKDRDLSNPNLKKAHIRPVRDATGHGTGTIDDMPWLSKKREERSR